MAEDTEMSYMARFSLDNSNFLSGMTGMAISFDAIVMAAQTSFASIQKGYDMTIGAAIQYANTLEDVSDATGISLESAQRLGAAAKSVGTDFDDASAALRMFTQRVADTGAAGEALRSRLESIGVSVKDASGNYKDMAQLMLETNSALKAMPEAAERANLAVDIYGRSWNNIADMIQKADTAKTNFQKSTVISDKEIENAKQFGIELESILSILDKKARGIGFNLITGIKDTLDLQNTSLGRAMGWHNEGGAERSADDTSIGTYEERFNKQAAVVNKLSDTYEGLSSTELELRLVTEDYTDAQDALANYTGQSQEEFDKLSLSLAHAKIRYDEVRQAMADVSTQMKTMNRAMAPGWSGESIVGEAGSEMQLFLQKEMDAGVDYQTAMSNWMNGSPTAGPGKNTVAGQSMSPAQKESEAVIKAAKATSEGMLVEYIKQEEYTKTHWIAITEMMRISVTDMATNWRKYVDFAAGYPTIHNIGIVVWNKGVPDWTPESNVVFMQAARRAQLASQDLSFKATDLSQVETNASKQQNSVNLTIINEKNVSSKVIQENSQATAANLSVNGAS